MPSYVFNTTDVLEVRYVQEFLGQRCLLNLHYALKAGETGADDGPAFVEAAATDFGSTAAGKILPKLLACQSVLVSTVRVEAQKVSPTRWAKKTQSVTAAGTREGDSMPSNVAWDITRRIDRARRRGDENHRGGVGTLHIAGLSRDSVVDNFLTDDFKDTLCSVLTTALVQERTVAGKVLVPVLWHRRAAVAPFFEQIQEAEVEPYARTMRNRGPLRGI